MDAEVLFTEMGHGDFLAFVTGAEPTTCQGALLIENTGPVQDNASATVTLRCKGCKQVIPLVASWRPAGNKLVQMSLTRASGAGPDDPSAGGSGPKEESD